MNVKVPPITMIEVSVEKAYEHSESLEQVQRNETNGTTVFTGIHPTLGPVHIIVPALGDSFVLPLVVQGLPL